MENTYHKVIVIGAGISGIGASKTLTAHNIPHLTL
jgi:cation diffusion facilitator CzcD-associated flavoprotein CzcO